MLPIAHLVSLVSFFLSEVNVNFVQNGKVINELLLPQDGNLLHLDWGSDYTGVSICQKS